MIEKAFTLYLLTLIIPVAVLILFSLCFIVGADTAETPIEFLKGYFYSGTFGGLKAWRIHLGVLFLCFIISIFES